ncbi:hypothetical protein HRI_001418000 [Hibiscus trionum]|uniref:Cystatin domain-containing protein n=1 Tax=Hibiscus trionum TaxID=183268 RepID=A0A9W7HII2_HIBTR|nr:hypothetical protein HRI_001418000 [Hibiscus trionum]
MQQFQQFLILLLPLLFVPSVISYGPNGLGIVEWKPITNTRDTAMIEAAEFAVDGYNRRANAGLTLLAVVSGETLVLSGTNYQLVLKVTDGRSATYYWTHVVERAGQKKLYSFLRLDV